MGSQHGVVVCEHLCSGGAPSGVSGRQGWGPGGGRQTPVPMYPVLWIWLHPEKLLCFTPQMKETVFFLLAYLLQHLYFVILISEVILRAIW